MRAKVKEAAQSSGRKAKFSQMSTFDKTFTVCGDILLFLFVLCIIVPMVYIVIASFAEQGRNLRSQQVDDHCLQTCHRK